ncbi:hypothetical protein, partial [Pantoea septica]
MNIELRHLRYFLAVA